MRISRRGFVGATAGAIGTWLTSEGRRLAELGLPVERQSPAAILDLGTRCVLRESLEGYRAALGGQAVSFRTIERDSGRGSGTVIVPAVGMIDRDAKLLLLDLLGAGTTVVFETGAGFVSREEFAVQQRTLSDGFGLMIDSPVDLWSLPRAVPYVNYSWPRETAVRDFSRVVPVLAPDDEIIGRAGSFSVASKRPVGNGLLIFLGSPLGPAMRAGDAEGQAWLRLLRTAARIF